MAKDNAQHKLENDGTKRDKAGKFVKGNVSNPTGIGGGAGFARYRQQILKDATPKVLQKLIADAEEGKPWAVRLMLERVFPVPKASHPLVELPPNEDPVTATQDILAASQQGIISSDHADVMLSGIRKALEIKILAEHKVAVKVIEVETGSTDQVSDAVTEREPE